MRSRLTEIPAQSARDQFLRNNGFEMSCRKSEMTKPTMIQSIDQKSKTYIKADFKSFFSTISESDRRGSVASTTKLKKFKKVKNLQSTLKKPLTEINENYDIWDLTYTLIQSKMKIYVSSIWFFTFLAIRIYTICCCVYISSVSVHLEWLIPFILVRVMFFILVLKISLNDATTKTQMVLKTHWNSIQSNTKQYFQVTSSEKLFTSILRGLIPAQLSFLYIKSEEIKRKYEIFTSINFIFVSIEEIIFYPFFIVYISVLANQKQFSTVVQYEIITFIITSFGFLIFLILTFYLFFLGVKKKYGGLRSLYNHTKYQFQSNKFDCQDMESQSKSVIST